jgi:hypothetical protein
MPWASGPWRCWSHRWATRPVPCRLVGCCRPGRWLGHHPTIASQAYVQRTTRGGVGSRDPGAPPLKWLMRGSCIPWHALMPMLCYGWPTRHQCRGGHQRAMVRREAWPACGSPRDTKHGHMPNGKQPSQGKAWGRQCVECSAPYLMEVEPRAMIERLLLERIALRGMCRAVGVGLQG